MPSTISAGTTAGTAIAIAGDTSGVLELRTNGTTTAVTIGTGQNTTFAQTINAPNTFGFKNRIINGAMVIDQRNAGASVTITSNSTYTLDRWVANMNQASKFSVQQNAGAVTPPVGFTNYLGITSLSAYSIGSSDILAMSYNIEGLNVADFGWGTANAKTVTLSFWVRSSLTGTFGGALRNSATSRSYPFSYTISSANTWEYKTITIPGDTTGTWLTNNDIGIRIAFGLGVGSTNSGTAGSWSGSNIWSATGATSVVGTNGATFYITGVQLEVGSTATSFDYRPYGTELALCQRYFINWVGSSTGSVGFPLIGSGNISGSTTAGLFIPTPVSLRSTPTVSFSGTVSVTDQSSSPALTSVSTVYTSSSSGFWIVATASSGAFTIGRGAIMYCQNASTNSFSASSEL